MRFPSRRGKINKAALITGIAVLFFILGIALFYANQPGQNPPNEPPIVATSTVNGAGATSTPSSTNPVSGNSGNTVVGLTGPVGHVIGIAAGSQLTGLGTTTLNQELDGMAALGITWVRFDIGWGYVQNGGQDKFDWSMYDRIFGAIAAHHMHPLGIIGNTPPWARTPGCGGGADCPPNDPAQFATFAAEVAARYAKDGAHYWEIWNEPNNYDFWATKTDCAAYTSVLKAAYTAIKKADPNSFIMTGGLAQVATDNHNIAPLDFLKCVYANGGQGYFDAVADHPYTFPQFPAATGTTAWNQMSTTVPSLRSLMVVNGDSAKKIWLTEFGVPTNGPNPDWYVSEASQTKMFLDAYQLYAGYDWAGPLFWYTYEDSGTAPDSNENFFGLVRADGSKKPAYYAIQSLISSGKL